MVSDRTRASNSRFITMTKVRYAVVGLGHIAQVAVLPAFAHAENSELAALITSHPDDKRQIAAKYGVPAYAYAAFEQALEEQQVDAAFIALPNTLHREYSERAAAMGVHVLCEKPMATTEEDCLAMMRACSEARVQLMIAYRLHFTDAHLRAIDLAKDGSLGDLRYFNSLFAMQVADDNIRIQRRTGGGTVHDIGIYCINAARHLFQSEPVQVLALTASADDERFKEVEEMTSVMLRFPGDRLATFTCSFGSADRDQFDLIGTKGTLHMEPAYNYEGDLQWVLKRGAEMDARVFPAGDQFAGEIIYFSKCIADGRKPEPSGEEGLADVRIINAIYESARTGELLTMEPIRKDRRPTRSQEIKRPPVEQQVPVGASSPSQE
jgi:predicted dehydrogenase